MKKIFLTGIKPTGTPHIGNWLGAIRPALEFSCDEHETLYFIADYHALTITPTADVLQENILSVTASWLALGLDSQKAILYRQSHIPTIAELSWMLSCFTPKGFMNRTHGYKDSIAKNKLQNKDPDDGVNMGFYSYPVLMAADILAFNTDVVPIGLDQKQHLEFTRDIASRFNSFYQQDVFNLPEPFIKDSSQIVVGLDGRKMSKSYDNTIPLFLSEKHLKNKINQIVTNSQTPEESKDPETSSIFALHCLFLSKDQIRDVASLYQAGGMGWGNAKSILFESINECLKKPREEYHKLMGDRKYLKSVLREGAQRATELSTPLMEKVKMVVGL